jgi:hypothetical protein
MGVSSRLLSLIDTGRIEIEKKKKIGGGIHRATHKTVT